MRTFNARFQVRLDGRDGMLYVRVCRKAVAAGMFPGGWSHITCGPLAIGVFMARLNQAEGLELMADVTDHHAFPSRLADGAFSIN